MATTNHDRVRIAMDLLKDGLQPFLERELKAQHGKYWITNVTANWQHDLKWADDDDQPHLDVSPLLRIMWEQWNDTFRRTLGHAERSLVSELREVRNRWAHQHNFSGDDTYRALDSAERLLTAVSASQAEEVNKMKMELLRLRFDEQVRGEKRKVGGSLIEPAAGGTLSPWREVVTPHQDVASGRFQQAEFAADLWQVHLGEGSDEYRDPQEFFRRTYLTESLRQLLVSAASRLTDAGGDPVVQLQTNFGGGKTHSMLALYHLFSGAAPTLLAGVDALLQEADVQAVPTARRVVLVGNKISPGNPVTKPDGTVVRTLWGELAWQLGGAEAFAQVAEDDRNATNPGDRLRELFNAYSPCLILIDEWVAYARQLHDQSDLPAGGFETQFSFAQALTESAKLAKACLLVISLPASDTGSSPHASADDAEVGGIRGREALERLRNVVGRVEASWRPASAEEGFEIVRRRLFETLSGPEAFKQRDVTARAFAELYRSQPDEFPPECREADYEQRILAAYPIHPEIFDRLYGDWSTLAKFQRTRGVLRLMAGVIHSLWENGDRNPLILPAHIPIDDRRVQFELTRYLSDNWVPVIEKDVDGPHALPRQQDAAVPGLGKFAASRRVARTLYLGSAPTATAAQRGLEDRRIKLGCVMPGESPAVFGDALRRLAATATYLYQDGSRYWYATQPTVTKLAEDRAAQLQREPDKVFAALETRLRADLRKGSDFGRIHALPMSSQDVPDDMDARLVVLGSDHPYSKEPDSPAEHTAKAMLDTRGTTPRRYRNSLVFLAADRTRLQDLDAAVRRLLAWESILAEREQLDLSPHQVKQADTQRANAEATVTAQLPETWQWLLVPGQSSPQSGVQWQAIRLSGAEPLAARAARKLRSDELLVTAYAPTRLRLDLDRVPLWRADPTRPLDRNHVPLRQLAEDYASYLYLPRLADPNVLAATVRDGLTWPNWETESFAFADSYEAAAGGSGAGGGSAGFGGTGGEAASSDAAGEDDAAPVGRFVGLRTSQAVNLPDAQAPGLLVRPDAARRQLEADRRAAEAAAAARAAASGSGATGGGNANETTDEQSQGGRSPDGDRVVPPAPPVVIPPLRKRSYHGTVQLDPNRPSLELARIAEEIIVHLTTLAGAKVTLTLEIQASIPDGAPDQVVRTVTENGRALKFGAGSGFELE